jgi:hypothetical protein
LRVIAQSLQFSYDDSNTRSLFVIDVPRALFDLRDPVLPHAACAEEDGSAQADGSDRISG